MTTMDILISGPHLCWWGTGCKPINGFPSQAIPSLWRESDCIEVYPFEMCINRSLDKGRMGGVRMCDRKNGN